MARMSIDLSQTDTKVALRIMMAEADVDSFANLARNVGIVESTFRSAISNDSIRISDMKKIADLMGYKVILEPK